MSKSKPGRCVHCLKSVSAITADHLFPRSWYPDTTPGNLEKWTFPACSPCNNQYGKIEEELRLLLAACLDPNSEAAAGIWQKALRSIKPEYAKNGLDALRRRIKANRFLKRIRAANPEWHANAMPEIYPDRPKGNIALLVPAEEIHKFIEKLVRGTLYLTERRYIEKEQEISVALLRPEDSDPIVGLLEEFGETHEREPGIRIKKGVAEDAKANAVFVFEIWNQFRFHGAVMDRE